MVDFLDRVPEDILVVLDEAYCEFVRDPRAVDGLELYRDRSNVCVLRTFSKAYGLAGLRVGFAVGARETIARLAIYRPPGSIGTISATVVAAALEDTTEMQANVARVEAERPRLAAALAGLGWDPQPSVTNFLLLDLATAQRSEAAAQALMARGLVPRTFGHGHPLAHCLRVTVRTPAEDERLIEAAREIAPTLPPPPAPETAA
jgi:histidinol-phosphate aminotransferase